MIASLEDASIQKTWEKLGTNEKQEISSMVEYLLIRHVLHKPQTNLSLPKTPHAIQQEEFSTAEFISAFRSKMFLQFCKNISAACETNA